MTKNELKETADRNLLRVVTIRYISNDINVIVPDHNDQVYFVKCLTDCVKKEFIASLELTDGIFDTAFAQAFTDMHFNNKTRDEQGQVDVEKAHLLLNELDFYDRITSKDIELGEIVNKMRNDFETRIIARNVRMMAE